MSRLRTNDKYRKELIEKIKAAGQDLIDRAEDFVGENIEYMADFDIWISDFSAEYTSPTIKISKEYASKNYIKKLQEENNQ